MAALIRAALCSENPSKLSEFRALFDDWDLEALGVGPLPPEDGLTYVENARTKAQFGRRAGPADRWMLADDSGIEAAALEGSPGVRTARWADGRHVEKILDALDGAPDRRARYVCELVCLSPEGEEHRGTGILRGTIALEPAGRGGFGFDPVFIPDGEASTVAELGDAWKVAHSHRALAARALLERLELGSASPN